MNKIIKSFMAAALLVGGGSLIDLPVAHAQGSASVGSLRGQIRDRANGEAAVGATVVATSPSLQGEQVVITEEGGQYFITSLPPGLYVLTVYFNDATFSRANVLIQVGKEAVVNVTVDSGATAGKPKGEVIEIKGTAPIVDQGSTKTGLTLTEDYTRNIPTARTFGGVVGQAAGAQSDNYGISFAGSTSFENTYIVEGINTTDTGFGGISSNLPNEFISETEVITGGYNAEFGRATGGIVNVVTKQGSNTFSGSVFGYYTPGGLVADANAIQREGGSIDSKTDLDYRYDVGAELGGPIIKDKLWFHVGFNPSVSHSTTQRRIQRQVDENQDGVPDVNPDTGLTVHDFVSSSEIPRDFKTYFFTGKINGAVNQNNQFQISTFGNPRSAVDVLSVTRNPSQTRWKYSDGAYDLAGKWTSKLNDGKTQIDGVVGYHRGFNNESPFSAAQDVPYVFYQYDRSLYDFADLEGGAIEKCNDDDPSDQYPEIRNCPVFGYAEQGVSLLEQEVKARTSFNLSATQRVKLAGYHVFKIGVDAEFAQYNHDGHLGGNAVFRRSADTLAGAPGRWQLQEYFKRTRNLTDAESEDPDSVMLADGEEICANGQAICERSDHLIASTNNRSLGAFLQDSWQLRPNFTINAGLRWEQQIGYVADELVGGTSPEGEITAHEGYKINNMIAPRIGFIYDPTREGKAKVFGHWGQFYENVPMNMNVRQFGGEIIHIQNLNQNRFTPTQGAYDPNCDIDHTSGMTGSQLAATLDACGDRGPASLLGGGTEYVSPGLRGQHTDELILGAEYEMAADFKVGANYIHRNLPVVIEDISVDGGNSYLITNPGFNFDAEADRISAEATRLMASSSPKEQALGELYASRADSLYGVKRLVKPVRKYDAVQITATQRPTKNSLLIASYTFSQSKGNYPGLFSTETGQSDPNLTSLYDLPDLMANRYGPMGLDRPHNIKIDGFHVFDLRKLGYVVTGASFRGQSGIAHNVLGEHAVYGPGEAYLLPRGAAERSPFSTQLDVRFAYGKDVSKTTKIEAFVNVFNLFNSQEQINQDENYTYEFVNPIIGGDSEDLKHLKTLGGGVSGSSEINATPVKNKNFGNTGGNNSLISPVQQSPLSVQLGFRLTF